MNDPSQMMNRGYGMWQPPPPGPTAVAPPLAPPAAMDDAGLGFQNLRQAFTDKRKNNWKGKKPTDKWKLPPPEMSAGGGGGGGYKPPALSDLQYQNRIKARRFYPKKKPHPRFAPFAPRNTTSFLIRAKKSGGIASLVSPCPVTPAILPTPKFSPSREVLMDMAKEEWGVDGYGSMSGLIRLRSPQENENEEIDEDGSSESDVEEHVEVERRLDHDLSRFEMVYPRDGSGGVGEEGEEGRNEGHVARLEEENLLLKERLYLMEREMGDLRRRLLALETVCKNERFGGFDQNFGDENEDNNVNSNVNRGDNNSMNGIGENEAVSEENDACGGGVVCSEKSVGDCEESEKSTPPRD